MDDRDSRWGVDGGQWTVRSPEVLAAQRDRCRAHGTAFAPPAPGERVGIALQTLGRKPLHGLRLEPEGGVCGWYLWAGEAWSDDPDFYQPLCVEHLADHCPEALPFLALPPGWRFLTADDYVDVWYQPAGSDEAAT